MNPVRLLGLILTFLILAPNEIAGAGETLDRIRSRGVLVVATDPAWPPMSWQKADGSFDGFDVDVSNEIARRLGVKTEFYLPYSFEEVLNGDWQGKWDMATSVTPTSQRGEKVTFAGVYWYGPSSLAVHRDNTNIQEPKDASGKKIGVIGGTEYEQYLTRKPFDILDMPPFEYQIDNPVIVTFDNGDKLFEAIATRRIDAVMDALSTLLQRVNDGAPIKIVGQPLTYTPSSLVVEKGDTELEAELKTIIEAMLKDGTLARFSEKWFGVDLTRY
jgi:polar amino acid transport system substrate-binding protein